MSSGYLSSSTLLPWDNELPNYLDGSAETTNLVYNKCISCYVPMSRKIAFLTLRDLM